MGFGLDAQRYTPMRRGPSNLLAVSGDTDTQWFISPP
jgi:hypothetical protein